MSDDRVRALTLRIGQLREQRDRCRAGRELEQNGLRAAVALIARIEAVAETFERQEMHFGGHSGEGDYADGAQAAYENALWELRTALDGA